LNPENRTGEPDEPGRIPNNPFNPEQPAIPRCH
jgi:hypothetical protein